MKNYECKNTNFKYSYVSTTFLNNTIALVYKYYKL